MVENNFNNTFFLLLFSKNLFTHFSSQQEMQAFLHILLKDEIRWLNCIAHITLLLYRWTFSAQNLGIIAHLYWRFSSTLHIAEFSQPNPTLIEGFIHFWPLICLCISDFIYKGGLSFYICYVPSILIIL